MTWSRTNFGKMCFLLKRTKKSTSRIKGVQTFITDNSSISHLDMLNVFHVMSRLSLRLGWQKLGVKVLGSPADLVSTSTFYPLRKLSRWHIYTIFFGMTNI